MFCSCTSCLHSESVENSKCSHLFILSLRVDKPAADCELEPNNQSAVVSIVMLSPMGKKKRMAKEHMTVCTLPVAAEHTETTETLSSKQISPEGTGTGRIFS